MSQARTSTRNERRSLDVLFVCTGNTCRSPLAAAYFNHRSAAAGVRAESAGLAAASGRPMAREARQVLAEIGIPAPETRSRDVTPELIGRARLVIAMTRDHAEALRRRFPTAAGKIDTLARAAGAAGDIPDPYGGGIEIYRRCFERMKPALDRLAERLAATTPGETS
jgi:protein-tyrosine-phosphatase